MLSIVLKLFDNLRERILSESRIWIQEAAAAVRKLFSFSALTISTKYPPMPKAFEIIFDLGLDTADFWLNTLTVVPFQAAASTLLDYFKVPGRLRQKVLTLDQASILVARVIVDEGIKTAVDPLPQEWQAFQIVNRASKIEDMIKGPSLRRLWKLFVGSLWTRIVRILLLVFTWGKMLGLLALLWRWTKAVSNEARWPVIFSGALRQDNPREEQKVVILRRVGGVAP